LLKYWVFEFFGQFHNFQPKHWFLLGLTAFLLYFIRKP
jgi:hypothetical protein